MSIIEQTLSSLTLGEAIKHENLTVFPLLADEECESDYLTLDKAISEDKVSITEVSEQGTVPELLLTNDADRPVLLLDGEELIGAKQNRIINLSILAAAKQSIKIPVSCVEHGRWAHRSDKFSTPKRVHYSKGRSKKREQVNRSMHDSRSRRSDQGEVWNSISKKAARMQSHSDTDAMSDIFEKYESSLDDFCTAFTTVPKQVGAVFAINEQIEGVELFDTTSTCKSLISKLIQSYALDAIDIGKENVTNKMGDDAVTRFLHEAQAIESESYPAIGLGEDIRLTGHRLCGGALTYNDSMVHFCLFRTEDDIKNEGNVSRIRSASARSRNRKFH